LDARLYFKPEKCELHKKTVKYLGLILLTQGISIDEDKVETARDCSLEMKTTN